MKQPDSGDRSKNRAYSAWQRGWINGDQLRDSLEQSRREGVSSLDVLGAKGLLDAGQLARLLCGEALPGIAIEEGISEEEPFKEGDLLAGKYRVFGMAQGGFGRVLFCKETKTGGNFALKALRRFHLRDPETVRRFAGETRRWLGLGAHPHIVRCHGIDELGGLKFLVMEYVEGGRTLLDEMLQSPENWRRTLRTALQVALGLAYCERVAGLVHGDIKPLNILITPDGDAKLTDMGLSYARLHETDETPGGGTPGYLAPELFLGARRSMTTDIYAYGITLWQDATGILPRMDDPATGRKDDLATVAPGMIPPAFAKLIMACVADDPEKRPASFAEIAHELGRLHETLLGKTLSPHEPGDLNLVNRFEAAVNAYNLADTLIATGKPREGLELARRSAHLNPEYWLAYDAMGRALLGLQRDGEAEGAFATAIHLRPDDPLLHAGLADAQGNQGKENEAVASLSTAVRLALENDNAGCLDPVSGIITRRLPPLEALKIHDAIIRANPAAARSWVNRTALLRMLDRNEEALESARRAVDLNPSDPFAWGTLSGVLTDMEEYAGALAAADRALSYDSTNASLYAQKVLVLYRSGEEAAAEAQLRNALAVWPDDPQLRQMAGWE